MIHAFIDGFNFYHVIQDHFEHYGENLKSLDYQRLIAQLAQTATRDVTVHFFTAKPTHLGTNKQIRHLIYTNALKATGVKIYEGRFKTEMEKCKADCRKSFEVWREKQTDVALSVALIHAAYQHPEGRFYLLTMDTDQIPAVRLLKNQFPKARFFWVIPPGKRASKEAKAFLHKKQFIYLTWKDLRVSQLDPKILEMSP
jgi:hypothetical protein